MVTAFLLERRASLFIHSVLYYDLLKEIICFPGQMSKHVSCAGRRKYFAEPACLSEIILSCWLNS